MRRRLAVMMICAAVIASAVPGSCGSGDGLTFCCTADNDLYRLVRASGRDCPRYDSAGEAVEKAAEGSAVLILADGYPSTPTRVPASALDRASDKRLKLYIEYPESLPGLEIGTPKTTAWERCVVSGDEFGGALPKMSIVQAHGCHYVPVRADRPMIVVARVAGYDTAVYGLPPTAQPVLFEIPTRNLTVATTKLSGFVTGRYAPTKAWETIWNTILARLDPADPPKLHWDPDVRPAYGPDEKLPRDAERRALRAAVKWVGQSRLLVHPSEQADIVKLLESGAESRPVPGPDEPVGDGSLGILEGYASGIHHDGSQSQRLPLRADCNAEVAMVEALGWTVDKDERARKIGENLLDYVFFNSGMCRGDRGNPEHPAFGLVAWGDVARAWMIANYGDDNARVILATILAAANLGSDRWDVPVMRALLANLRTTGALGFRTDRINMKDIEKSGWRAYHDASPVNLSPHFESYLWACYLWAYRQTGYKPFLDRTKTGIRMMMDAFPTGWRWNDSNERSRMLLCLSWLVRLEDTAEHRGWLATVAHDLFSMQHPSGALLERIGGMGRGHYQVPATNEAYGTGETPLIQKTGDPASDLLYTVGFALLGIHEAAAATGDPAYRAYEDKLAQFLCRVQARSPKHPYLDGYWFRAFDSDKWDYWSSSADIGWGAWSIESGWAQAWGAATLGLRLQGTSFWDATSGSRIASTFRQVHQEMSKNNGEPYTKP